MTDCLAQPIAMNIGTRGHKAVRLRTGAGVALRSVRSLAYALAACEREAQ
jgi:hypothetical protein